MQLIQTVGGEAIRFITVRSAFGATVHGVSLRSIAEHFKFADGPRDASALDLGAGITFLNGLFRNEIVIDQLKLHDDGIVLQSKTDTVKCDQIIDELIELDCGLLFEGLRETAYFSALVTEMDIEFDERFKTLQPTMDALDAALASAGQLENGFEPFAIQLWANKNSRHQHFFRLEKRVNTPGAFYSTAPMRTADHLELLAKIEAILICPTS